uniref:Uncharacterized protein n=1 Tax=Aegilops tauschii subsp. strangulata TaxID=200361 RepID=A0A453NZK4_AEGTS
MMTLRMGPSPANVFVNAGHAAYTNPTGPSPIMVQATCIALLSYHELLTTLFWAIMLACTVTYITMY